MMETHFSSTEQERFGERLVGALRQAGVDAHSGTSLAREFNVRFPHQSVTVHAARKWLKGEAIPTQDKLISLAHWLGVRADWLRYDGEETPNEGRSEDPIAAADLRLIADLWRLDDRDRALVRQFVHLLLTNKAR